MKNRTILYILAAFLITPWVIGGIDQMTLKALKVQHILKKIEKHPSRPSEKNQTAEVTQKELNAYIGHRIAKEKAPQIDSLKLVLMNDNKVIGKLRSNARHLNLGILFGDLLDIDFKGVLQTKSGKARLDLSDVQLNGLPIQPQMLDTIIDAVARYNGTEATSINDWYDLPKGINRVLVNKGIAVLHY